jgi:hypothetical protein
MTKESVWHLSQLIHGASGPELTVKQTSIPRKSPLKTINAVVNRLLHRGQDASTPAAPDENSFSNDGVDPPPTLPRHPRRPYNSERSSYTYPAPKGATVVDPFIEQDEIRRQKLMVDKCEQRFLRQSEMPPTAGFCNSCSRIDFEAIYKDHEITLGGSTAFSLQDIGIIDETWSQRMCRLCRFFAAIWEANKFYLRSARLCLVVLSSRNISKYAESIQIPKAIRHHNILVLSHPQPQRVFEVDPTTLDNLDIVGPLFPSRHKLDVEKCISVHSIKPDRVEFSIVRRWLQLCSRHHGESCSSSTVPDIPGFQLLNCKAKKLEPYIPGMEFIALSYVWGTNVNEQMHQNNEQGYSVFPQTIEDALKVTRELGFQYLWVDRYCIPRHDDRVKHIQIANMDLVYNCATLTIVAAGGQNSASGLPGVSRSRDLQPSINVGKYDLVSALSNPVRDVRHSKWMGRGWTYQEALLSKRRLFFTEKQVYFECGRATFMETVTEPEELLFAQADAAMKREIHSGSIDTLLDTRHRLFPADYLSQISEGPWLIQHRLADYTARSLTFESDTLNAFLGILRHFRNLECSISHVWGVPVLWSSAAKWSAMEGFATGLSWIGFFPTTQVIERRFEFPSWSWAGWKMPISPKSYFYRSGFKTPYEIKIDFETEHGKILDWAAFQTASQADDAPVLSRYLHIEAWSLKCSLHNDPHVVDNIDASLRNPWSLTTEGSTAKLHRVVIHKQYSNEEWNTRGNKLWDIIVIGNPANPVIANEQFFEQYPPFGPFFMILEDMGEYYERIGYSDLAHSLSNVGQDMSIHLVGKKRRSFRLG